MTGVRSGRPANRRVTQTRDEMADGIRVMLARPLLTREMDEAAFTTVRRKRAELTAWFDYFCGWTLTVEARQGYARLAKVRAAESHLAVPRPALRTRGSNGPFDRRRYVLFCLAAAELTVLSRTTIGLLAQRVAHTCAAEEGIADFDSANRTERAALVDALMLLERFGAITAVDGVTESYLAGTDALVLYRADTARLARLLSVPVPPSRMDGRHPDLHALLYEERYGPPVSADTGSASTVEAGPTHHQRLLWARHSLMRRLLDDPVVLLSDLSPAEADYAATPTGRRMLRRAASEAGLALEERAEGFLLVDPEGVATDDRFPGEGHVKQTALLLLDVLLDRPGPVSLAALAGEVEGLLERRPSWAKSFRSEGGAARLASSALDTLVGHGLARASPSPAFRDAAQDADSYTALPAAHRYAVDRDDFGGTE